MTLLCTVFYADFFSPPYLKIYVNFYEFYEEIS